MILHSRSWLILLLSVFCGIDGLVSSFCSWWICGLFLICAHYAGLDIFGHACVGSQAHDFLLGIYLEELHIFNFSR